MEGDLLHHEMLVVATNAMERETWNIAAICLSLTVAGIYTLFVKNIYILLLT